MTAPRHALGRDTRGTRGTHVATRGRPLRSARLWLLLALTALGLVGVTGTYAFWTDDAVISGTGLTAGTLDLRVNNADSYATTTLAMAAMVPGSSSAEVLTVGNGGTAALTYTLAGGLTGTGAAAYASAGALKLTITTGSRSGSGSTATCGGSLVVGPVALTTSTTTVLVGSARGPLAPGATEALCFQVTLDGAAPSSLQGRTATAVLTATASSGLS